MSANPSKRDRWPQPQRTRHVLAKLGRPTALPQQGLIVEWRLRGNRWWALVAMLDDQYPDARLVLRWLPGDDLLPVPFPDPNQLEFKRRR